MAQLFAIAASQAGPAHSFMLGEALQAAAARLGHELKLRVVSSFGTQDGFSAGELAQAGAVILAADAGSGIDRSALPADRLLEVAPEAVFRDPAEVVRQALARLGMAPAAAPAAPAAAPAAQAAAAARPLKIVAVTSCPTGVAHTFMAAEALEQGAKALGHQIHVETQGSVGAQNTLSAQAIAEADLVLIAADTQVDRARFAGKRLYGASTKAAIHDAAALIGKAQAEAAPWQGDAPAAAAAAAPAGARSKAAAGGPYKHLMTGVSFMLPFVVAGGLLIALAFALGGIYVADDAHQGTLGWSMFQVGSKAAFALMVPALAGYIAFSIADRPGIAPGMVGGMLAGMVGAGFLGGIAAGFIAGYAVKWLNQWIRLPRGLEGLKPVLLLPLLGSAIVGLLMLMVIGKPVAGIMTALTEWLKGMQSSSAVLLGVTLGAMMAADMGGPINKAAYVFSTSLIASGVATPMAAAMAAGMVPPLGIALACRLFASRFTAEEREASKAAAVLGLAFITEGAIPYVARDPLRMIPACVLGAATAGALSMWWGIALQAPHGGVFVLAIPNAVNHVLLYAAAIVAGSLVTALALRVLKKKVAA
ncbi:fructose-specific PTS transporter subunit EIIC [Pseudorhodoferax sp.]|uniref:fructose-specific PTS transporter subunit EIIC n=1 Tax=Pseudorhodoferax sp. TaxID=1993553 RepID=UPI0039E54700